MLALLAFFIGPRFGGFALLTFLLAPLAFFIGPRFGGFALLALLRSIHPRLLGLRLRLLGDGTRLLGDGLGLAPLGQYELSVDGILAEFGETGTALQI
ncbi:hypothetical protein CCR96_15195, partial [Halochromatium roseum]|nr:hypothetical protein [Halochromatium roseum]